MSLFSILFYGRNKDLPLFYFIKKIEVDNPSYLIYNQNKTNRLMETKRDELQA